ncbi:MAG: hypothetical protein WCG26_12990 [Chloroflexales bacterium]
MRLGDGLPPDHLARFVVDTLAHLDLTAVSARYGARGGQPYAPEIFWGLVFSGDATTLFAASRATCILTTTPRPVFGRPSCPS